jgi:hypothetical protein
MSHAEQPQPLQSSPAFQDEELLYSCLTCRHTRTRVGRDLGCLGAEVVAYDMANAAELEVVNVSALSSEVTVVLEVERRSVGFVPVDRAVLAAGTKSVVRVPVSLVESQPTSTRFGPNVRFAVLVTGVLYGTSRVGAATLALSDLVRHPTCTLLIQDEGTGLPVTSGSPPVPCELTVGVAASTLPAGWPRPSPPVYEGKRYPRHVFMMSRGTRGDVQPFVALAVGMATRRGWMVTVCTELRWRDFVLEHAEKVERGVVRFLPCGGDTELETSGWLYAQVMSTTSDTLQTVMKGASEWNFFPSTPVLAHQVCVRSRACVQRRRMSARVRARTHCHINALPRRAADAPRSRARTRCRANRRASTRSI